MTDTAPLVVEEHNINRLREPAHIAAVRRPYPDEQINECRIEAESGEIPLRGRTIKPNAAMGDEQPTIEPTQGTLAAAQHKNSVASPPVPGASESG